MLFYGLCCTLIVEQGSVVKKSFTSCNASSCNARGASLQPRTVLIVNENTNITHTLQKYNLLEFAVNLLKKKLIALFT